MADGAEWAGPKGRGGVPQGEVQGRTGSGRLTGLHRRLGHLAIEAAGLFRGRVTLGVRLLALDDQDRVFLVRHSYLPGLHLPGGGVDPGESCRTAALREAWEEGRLEVSAAPALAGVYWNEALGRRDHVVLFVARGASQAAGWRISAEIREAAFHPLDALPPDVTRPTRARIGEVLDGRPASESW